VRHPADFLRFLAHNWRWRRRTTLGFWRGVYRRLPFVGQHLDVLHLELDTLAPEFADMKEFLGCRLVLSGRSSLQFTGRPDEWPGGFDALFGLADAYHVETAYTRDNLHALGLDPAVPIWMIRSSIDAQGLFVPDPERPVRAVDDPFRVLTVSRLAVAKGIEFALEAVALVRRAGVPVRYTIVGEGEYEVALRATARQLGLLDDGVVQFAGGVARERIVDFYRDADVLLHASTDEGLPNVPLEGQAMELPVVATAAAGTPDAVEHGVSGFVVPPRDPSALAEQLLVLARDPALGRRMGEAGRRRILEGFDVAGWIPQYADRYRELSGR
jgi:glycosyltransferase involved in cell wall biosynthesis